MGVIERDKTIEHILGISSSDIRALIKKVNRLDWLLYSTPYSFAKKDPDDYYNDPKLPFKRIIETLVESALGKRSDEFTPDHKKYLLFEEAITLKSGGTAKRKTGMIEQNHGGLCVPKHLMAKGGTFTECAASIPHDFPENKSKKSKDIRHNLVHYHRALDQFVDRHLENKEYFKEENTKVTIILDLLTRRDYESYSDFINRLISLPADTEILELYRKEFGLFNRFEGKYSADQMVVFIGEHGWDQRDHAGKDIDPTMAEQVEKLRSYFITEIALPAMNIKIEDRRDNTIKVKSLRKKADEDDEKTGKDISVKEQTRSNHYKNLVDGIPQIKRRLKELEKEGFDVSRTYSLMEDLRETTIYQIENTILNVKGYLMKASSGTSADKIIASYQNAIETYDKYHGFDAITPPEGINIPKTVPSEIREIIDVISETTKRFNSKEIERKKEKTGKGPKNNYETLEQTLLDLLALKHIATRLGERDFIPDYRTGQEELAINHHENNKNGYK